MPRTQGLVSGLAGLSLLSVLSVLLSLPGAAPREVVYHVGIVEDFWDYAPSGKNLINGNNIADDPEASIFLQRGPQRIGGKYKKAMYRQYTDGSFSRPAPRPLWLGYLGPLIRAEVGDVIVVHLMNKASRNYSMHPHGVFYKKDSEGALYPDGTSGRLKQDDAVPPGGRYTYRWEVRPEFGPTGDDADCLTWVYHSHVEAPRDIASGLIGPLLTCKPGVLLQEGVEARRHDVDRDFYVMFNVVDEALSWYLEDNIQTFIADPDTVDRDNEDFQESNLMHAINGYMFGNLPGVELCEGRPTSWHLIGMGNEVDIHSAYFHGNTVLDRGHRTDVLSLFPATFATAEMVPLALGRWLLSCQVNDHLMGTFLVACRVTDHYSAGMRHQYQVDRCPGRTVTPETHNPTKVITYYISTEETEWDYSPDRTWEMENHPVNRVPSGVFLERGEQRIGSCYKKAVFREYTDETFSTPQKRQQHLGILGPLIQAEVGERIRVIFKNRASRPYAIHAHGIQKSSHFLGLNPVAPGLVTTVDWDIPESSGPGPSDPTCITYVYFSPVDFIKDMYSGLLGPLVICRRGTLRGAPNPGRERKDVTAAFALLFLVFDENQSWYLDDNIKTYFTAAADPGIKDDEDFQESNKMHGINGLLYGNLRGLEMSQGQKVDWYLLGMGGEVDLHTVHFHAETFTYRTDRVHRADVFDLFPGTFQTVEMMAGNPGTWLLHCHVTDHIHAGMETTFTIRDCTDSAPARDRMAAVVLSLCLLLMCW
ncbi:unnamed protein product [Merluccius merluccius]